jgi:hypothetical protein
MMTADAAECFTLTFQSYNTHTLQLHNTKLTLDKSLQYLLILLAVVHQYLTQLANRQKVPTVINSASWQRTLGFTC